MAKFSIIPLKKFKELFSLLGPGHKLRDQFLNGRPKFERMYRSVVRKEVPEGKVLIPKSMLKGMIASVDKASLGSRRLISPAQLKKDVKGFEGTSYRLSPRERALITGSRTPSKKDVRADYEMNARMDRHGERTMAQRGEKVSRGDYLYPADEIDRR